MLISHFDFLVSDLIRHFHHLHPDNLSGKDPSISYNELKLFGDIPEALEYLISKEVEKILYSNLEDQKNTLKTISRLTSKKTSFFGIQ